MREQQKAVPGKFKLDIRKNSFTVMEVKHWNRLTSKVGVLCRSGFKRFNLLYFLVSPELVSQLDLVVFVDLFQLK